MLASGTGMVQGRVFRDNNNNGVFDADVDTPLGGIRVDITDNTATLYTIATDASGAFTIVGDAGRYRVEVVPPAAVGLPRKIVSVELSGGGVPTQLPALQLSAALTVVGTVSRTGSQVPVAGATVDFFALDSSGSQSVLIGSGLTNASGQYRAVLPDVPAPAN